MGRPMIRDQRTALMLGLALTLAGVFVLRDAYEHRGTPRPLWLSFIPG